MAADVCGRIRPAQSVRRTLRLPLSSASAGMRTLLILGAVSGACYLVVYLAQRALFLNGLPGAGDGAQSLVPGVILRGTPPDSAVLPWQLTAYYGGTIGLFACYARLLRHCRLGLGSALVRRVALAIPVAFHLGLFFGRPTLSRDVYTYIAHGYLAARLGANPYVVPASAVADTALGRDLVSAGWLLWREVTPYGPLWTLCEALALYITDTVPLAVLLLKALVVGASLGSAALIWRILGLIAPQIQFLGTAAYLWNPLIALEIAGDGHNDALMALCVLAALLATLNLRPSGTVLGLILGALVKYLPLLFLPAQFVYLRHSARAHPGLLRRAAPGLLLGALGAAVAIAGFWAGAATYRTIPEGGQRGVTASLSGALIWTLARLLPPEGAAWLVALALNALAAGYTLAASWGARTPGRLVEACAAMSVFYLLVASPVLWPWYATLPIALLALAPRGNLAPLLIVLPLCLRLIAPLSVLYEHHFITWPVAAVATVIAIAIALLAFARLDLARWRRVWDASQPQSSVTGW